MIGHLTDVRARMERAPDLTLSDEGGKAVGCFEGSFVPRYEANLNDGLCETSAKTV